MESNGTTTKESDTKQFSNSEFERNNTNKEFQMKSIKETQENKKVDLDTILIEELGQFGLYQLWTVLLAALVVMFSAWASVEYIFTTARIPTRCLIPECEDTPLEFSPSWLGNAVPLSGSGFDNCQRYTNLSIITPVPDGTCPASLFNQSRLMDCEEYVYENTYSVVYDFSLACDEWLRSLIGSIRTVGVLLALPITGFVSDRWGRRIALTLNAFNTAWLGTVRYFANTYVGFVISELAEATFGSGIFSCAYILMMEIVGPKYRVAAGAAMNTCFAIGQVTMGFIAWGVPHWRELTLALYLPMFVVVSYFWLMSESVRWYMSKGRFQTSWSKIDRVMLDNRLLFSPAEDRWPIGFALCLPMFVVVSYFCLMSESVRWYMSKGRFQDSERVLKNIARVNKKELSAKSLELLRLSVESEKLNQELEKQRKANEPWLIVKVFQHKSILLRCAVSPLWWITTTFIYYGLSINAVNLSGNRYLNYVAVSAVEIPGFWIAFLLMSRIGRKPVLTGAFWLCAACQIGYIFTPDGLDELSLALYLVGKCSIAMVMTAIYVYTNELYPTEYRHSLFAFSSMVGRIGSILAPLTPALGAAIWDELPFALFGGFALVSGALVLLTPETLGSRLPDTMREANDIGKKEDP